MNTEIDAEPLASLWPRRSGRANVANPARRSRVRDASTARNRLRPPRWSARLPPSRGVA